MRYIVSKKVLVVSQSSVSSVWVWGLSPWTYRAQKIGLQNIFKKDPGRAKQKSQGRARTNFTKPHMSLFLSLYIQNQQMSVPRDRGTTTEVQPIFCNKLEWPSQNLCGLLVLFCWSSVLLPLATNGHCFSMPVGPLPLVAVGLACQWPKQILAGSYLLDRGSRTKSLVQKIEPRDDDRLLFSICLLC